MAPYVYVASSWRCPRQPAVIDALRTAGVECYDFRHPAPGDEGFRWPEVGLEWTPCSCDHTRGPHGFCSAHGEPPRPGRGCDCPRAGTTRAESFRRVLDRPVARTGFAADFAAMQRAHAFLLVLPCGRSAHLELGWAAGAGKPIAVLLDDPCTPELMYLLADLVTPSLDEVLAWL